MLKYSVYFVNQRSKRNKRNAQNDTYAYSMLTYSVYFVKLYESKK